MTKNLNCKTIMFTDIASSTQLYQRLGDTRAKAIIDTCMNLLSQSILRFDGLIIKTIGDEIMSSFVSADQAILAAIEMNCEIENRIESFHLENFPLNVYTGIHYGHVIEDKGDLFGDAVNIAARMVKQAKQRQIIITFDTFKQLKPHSQKDLRSLGCVKVKGITEEIDIYEVVWEQEEMTVIMNTSEVSLAIEVILSAEYDGKMYKVGQKNPSLTIGRQNFNDIVIDGNFVSRAHAAIEFRKNSFVLIDKSSNGTFVKISEKNIVRVRKDEIPLNDQGVISVGDKTFSKSGLIRYKIIKKQQKKSLVFP